ncbi:DUF5689 domain-containing protein [Alistipes sp. OttesenSCG-928-B03]|nr:DUF5689 domain-containing protein [Alistipes sp. OttesenSCG-928-B03]
MFQFLIGSEMAMAKNIMLFVAVLLASCGYNRFDVEPPDAGEYLAANADIGTLRALYDGATITVDEEVIIAGVVTANDRSGNFYRSFIIEDATGAVEVRAGMFSLHRTFRRGQRVAVKLQGLAVGVYNGVVQVGRRSMESGSQTEYIASRYVAGTVFWPQRDGRDLRPVEVSVAGLTDAMCGRLVRISGLCLIADEAVAWAEGGTTYRHFEDSKGGEIAVQTSTYADFADKTVPAGEVALTGILMRGNIDRGNRFFIKLRDVDDIEIQ